MLSIEGVIKKVFGTRSDRWLKRQRPLVGRINSLESTIKALSDDELRNQTAVFRQRIDNGSELDVLLPEVFATVREVAVRTMGMRHYDVQMLGGLVLHQGMAAEMKTGEGKTLTATLPVYLNALSGKGAHVATVNDYLASRDADWMAKSEIPKLFINAVPGTILVGPQREFCRSWPNQQEVTVPGLHFVQEDSPAEIGQAVANWLQSL